MQICNAALQTLLAHKPLENIIELSNEMYVRTWAATGKPDASSTKLLKGKSEGNQMRIIDMWWDLKKRKYFKTENPEGQVEI